MNNEKNAKKGGFRYVLASTAVAAVLIGSATMGTAAFADTAPAPADTTFSDAAPAPTDTPAPSDSTPAPTDTPSPTDTPAPTDSTPAPTGTPLVFTSGPTIAGDAVVGSTLTVDFRTNDGPDDVVYTWYDQDDNEIGHDDSLVLTDDLLGSEIYVLVEATTDSGGEVHDYSESTESVVAALTNLTAPTLSGGSRVGDIVTLTPGTWSDPAAVLTYSWGIGFENSGSGLDGTSNTYTITSAEIGGTIAGIVTAPSATRPSRSPSSVAPS